MIELTREQFIAEYKKNPGEAFNLRLFYTKQRQLEVMRNPGIGIIYADYGYTISSTPIWFKLISTYWISEKNRLQGRVDKIVIFDSEAEWANDKLISKANQIYLNRN